MRKFLVGVCLSALSLCAVAADPAAIVALDAFRSPMENVVREAAKGKDTDFDILGKSWAEADKAWKAFAAETLDLDSYGVPAAKQDEVWRRVRMAAMLVRYIDEGLGRGDMSLVRRSAQMLPQAYADLRAALAAK
jgi:hypothetical protein